MSNDLQFAFSKVPVMLYVFVGLILVTLIVLKIAEEMEYQKTYKKMPPSMRPSRSWWKQNKAYARAMMGGNSRSSK